MRPRRALAAILLALAAAGARADWTPVGEANEIYAAYADRESLHVGSGRATMHGLYDFRRRDFTPQGRELLSTVVLREYDCEGRRVRLVSAIDFSGPMGQGEPVLVSADAGRWEAVLEEGIDASFWRFACAGGREGKR